MDLITQHRQRIDSLDAQLVALIEQRLAASQQIQAARMAQGGPRVVHAREAQVLARWREQLGTPGARIALALLELSRGPVAGA